MTGLSTPYSYLTGMYSRPGEFVSGINQVLSISESGVSIFAVVIIVCLILYIIYHNEN